MLKPGEMCLVLGIPGSGCSEFLMTMANTRPFANVTGEVLYAGIDSATMAQYYGGEVLYSGPGKFDTR
jgi:ATP-binding cassette, subfamily G (WHITE), member 2, SNQ2